MARNPHPQSLTVGGVTCVMDLMDPARMGEYMSKFAEIKEFVDRAYYPDILMAAKAYANEPSVLNDVGVSNLFCYDEFLIGKMTIYLKAVSS